MTGYVCDRCPLAFEVGYYGYWDLSGGCVQYVCRRCGTMHKVEHLQNQPDMLFALDAPIRGMVDLPFQSSDGTEQSHPHLPVADDSWRAVGPLPTAVEYMRGMFVLPDRAMAAALGTVACHYCGTVGGLVSYRWPLSPEGTWPSFGDRCPVCRGDLRESYVDTIN